MFYGCTSLKEIILPTEIQEIGYRAFSDSGLESIVIPDSIEEIKYIIVSHLHPDHIGGLKFFPNSNLILTETCYNSFKSKKDNFLIFNELLPDDFENRLTLIRKENYKENKLFLYKNSFDLFSDSSMLMVEIDGHAKGQACVYMPELKLLIGAENEMAC